MEDGVEEVNDGRVNREEKKKKRKKKKKSEKKCEKRNRSDRYSIARHVGHA